MTLPITGAVLKLIAAVFVVNPVEIILPFSVTLRLLDGIGYVVKYAGPPFAINVSTLRS